MKNILLIIVGAAIVAAGFACSKKCDSENPQSRIVNNNANKVSVQIQTSGGNTVNINNIAAGTSSAYSSYAPGNIVFTVSIDKVQGDQVTTVTGVTCTNYDIVVNANNLLTTVPTSR